MRIGNYIIEAHLRARRPWTHFKIHDHSYYKHLVWGKLSMTFGQPHLVPVTVCVNCYEEIQGLSAGDEGWDYCEGCHQVEPDTMEMTTEEYEAHHG